MSSRLEILSVIVSFYAESRILLSKALEEKKYAQWFRF